MMQQAKPNTVGVKPLVGRAMVKPQLRVPCLPLLGCSTATVPRPLVPTFVRTTAPTTPGASPPSVRRYSEGLIMQTKGYFSSFVLNCISYNILYAPHSTRNKSSWVPDSTI